MSLKKALFGSLILLFVIGASHADDQVSTVDKVENALRSVVHLETYVMKQRFPGSSSNSDESFRKIEETGSGVVVSIKEKTWILTNRHVIANVQPDTIRAVLSDHRKMPVERVLTNAEFDLALLEIKDNDVPRATIGDSSLVRLTDSVFVLGSPFGLSQSVSKGIISGVNRCKIPQGDHAVPLYPLMQTDAAVNPGNSGGPIVNEQGEVIGIVTAIASSSGTNEGVGFAIPITEVMQLAEELVENEKIMRPSLGIELEPELSDADREQAGMLKQIGVKVKRVTPESPADQVGVKPGDIVVKYKEMDIENDAHLVRLIAQSKINEEPTLVFIRGKAPFEVKPKLAAIESH